MKWKSTLFTLLPLSVVGLIYFSLSSEQNSTIIPSKNTESNWKIHRGLFPFFTDSISEITISLVGDLMCHKPQMTNALKKDGTYDFNPSFDLIRPWLQRADITIGNLETTLAGNRMPYAGYPAFNSPDAYAAAIKNAGFDFLVIANNHSMDTGEEGLLRTIEIVKKEGLGYCGTYQSQRDRDSVRILKANGIRIAILNYTYGTNGKYPDSGHEYMLNKIDSELISKDIARAKLLDIDQILVFYHYGAENKAEPLPSQKTAVTIAKNAGADLIIGAHPHVVGPAEYFLKNNQQDSGFIAYSLGNFISNQPWRYTDAGVICNITLQKNHSNGKTRIKTVNYTPTWVYRGEHPSKKMHMVIPCQLIDEPQSLPVWLDSSDVKKLKEAYSDTKDIFTRYCKSIPLSSKPDIN